MGAPEIIDMLKAPHNAHRALSLSLTWPSLAAALAELCYDNDQRPPNPLRVAHQAVRSEGYVGDTAVAAIIRTKGKE
jgi:hypothetical protein